MVPPGIPTLNLDGRSLGSIANRHPSTQGAGSSAAPSWSSLFIESQFYYVFTNMEYYEPTGKDGISEVPNHIVEEGENVWKHYLVGYFIEKRLPFLVVKNMLQKLWIVKGNFEMVADKELFYFKFGCEEDRQMVIEQGPIFVVGRVFVIRPWTDDLDSQRKEIQTVPVWVKMDLPKILWTEKGISFVARRLGKPLCVDAATANRTRLNYVKVCIAVDASCKFPDHRKFNLGKGRIVDVTFDYPWIPSFCSKCVAFGYSSEKCNKG
ncbi:hypothetical protein IFM89_003555 [Coptis chinensis]|uniref:DUF4283 domain-containing protein n=1 Tax=Coptis chinensis TaxID=261450 RepID=A0A835GYG7_9MAGN|nr:hypothetical protein IFM89_003555 [Coptis chinensis]